MTGDGSGQACKDGGLFPNLYAVGGAAVGVSGSGDAGYLSGNGLLSAVVLGQEGRVGRSELTRRLVAFEHRFERGARRKAIADSDLDRLSPRLPSARNG